MCRKYKNTYCVVNMDNYYTSPAILILLHNHGMYARCTGNKNRRMIPSQIVLTKADSKKESDGYVRMAVSEFTNMQNFGWNANNQVHILSTAELLRPVGMDISI
jgi:hypothetical protein